MSDSVRACEYCGAARVYELQLLPYLMSRLDPESPQQNVLDWATVCVYTCGESCWSRAEPVRTEQVMVQLDPDAALIPSNRPMVRK